MEYVMLIIILARLIVPLSIPKWPLWGIIAAILADTWDYIILDSIIGVPSNYQQIDKLLDLYYLAIAALVSLKWKSLAKKTSIALFSYRTVGMALFLATQTHSFLFFFPNLFEPFFVFEAARQRFFQRFALTRKRLLIVLILLLIPKLINEYSLHIAGFNMDAWIKNSIILLLGAL